MESILIIGKPNSGKSLLFNKLTGVFQKVSNFPGVTVEVKTAVTDGIELADYPGIYSLQALTKDEDLAIEKFKLALKQASTKLVLCVLDATRLERSLNLGWQIQQFAMAHNKPVLFALNMMDELQRRNISLDLGILEQALGAKVMPISARKGEGIAELKSFLVAIAKGQKELLPHTNQDSLTKPSAIFARELSQKLNLNQQVFLQNQNQIDAFVLHNFFGGLFFMLLMLLVFQSIFSWAAPAMDFTEWVITSLGSYVAALLPAGPAQDFVNDAFFGGLGSFLVFVPQIFVLSFIIGILEDSGYLARAAVICHKPFSYFGLTGKSFIPLLTGHACAIPAIFATRTIESPKRRLLTMLSVPLTACSARLPVYSLLIVSIIPSDKIFGSWLSWQGLSFFFLYLFGIFMALVVAAILSKSLYREESDAPFVLELPSYRMPQWQSLMRKSYNSALSFVTNAGGIIFLVSVVVWVLGYFPNSGANLADSYLGSLGQWIEPVFSPLGIDWKFGVAILTSFLAREVFVGTLGTMMGIEGADEDIGGLSEKLMQSGLSFASGISLLVFYALAMQCVSTLAVIRKETGRFGYAVLVFFAYGAIAYALAWMAYRLLV